MPIAGAGGRFAHVAGRGREVGAGRREAQKRSAARKNEMTRMVSEIMMKYDTDRSGQLNTEQVRELLTDLDHTTRPGTAPSDEEVLFVMQCADSSRNKSIDRDELIGAITVWNSYIAEKKTIDAVLARHDTDGNGSLDRAQLKTLLVELNEGLPVPDEDVEAVMKHADLDESSQLKRVEVLLAINFWYHMAEIEEEEKGKGGCCVVL
eukprot:TRINITY_DN4258_c0_g1_i5.p2 TRINITY_DN4258_c0_g1~~TRINITY_DN4258_c0_g1_i5.p2  ORF type:complete len:207 (+),score=73.01 TRINITY_DN4258_c0_g1_i5:45-665(+)